MYRLDLQIFVPHLLLVEAVDSSEPRCTVSVVVVVVVVDGCLLVTVEPVAAPLVADPLPAAGKPEGMEECSCICARTNGTARAELPTR
jgi:hypothetical protein